MRKRMIAALAACAAGALLPAAAMAAPGLGDEVYDATTTKGELELESRYGALMGGADDGEDAAKLEVTYSPTDRLRLATLLELEREPGGPRRAEAAGFEAIYTVGRFAGIDVAVYGEYEVGLRHDTSDAVEGKLILQRKAGAIDARLNLIFEKHLARGEKVEVGYAAMNCGWAWKPMASLAPSTISRRAPNTSQGRSSRPRSRVLGRTSRSRRATSSPSTRRARTPRGR